MTRLSYRFWTLSFLVVLSPLVFASLAPVVAPETSLAEGAEALFSPICHQRRARTLWIAGHPMALCNRCSGILWGLWLAGVMAALGLRVPPNRLWMAVLPALLLVLHVGLGSLWSAVDVAGLRVVTGLALGIGAMLSFLSSVASSETVRA